MRWLTRVLTPLAAFQAGCFRDDVLVAAGSGHFPLVLGDDGLARQKPEARPKRRALAGGSGSGRLVRAMPVVQLGVGTLIAVAAGGLLIQSL